MIASNLSADEVVCSSRSAQRKLKLYEQLLGLRIQMQKPIQLIDKLPPVVMRDGEYVTLELGIFDATVSGDLRGMLSTLGSLQGIKDSAFSEVPHSVDDLDCIWSGIVAQQQRQYNSLWRPVLDKMHDKTLLGGGVKAQSLKVFHTSFWNKVLHPLPFVLFLKF